jgi:hypothetical protein
VVEVLGDLARPPDSRRRLDVELALLICEWYGNAVLSADGG